MIGNVAAIVFAILAMIFTGWAMAWRKALDESGAKLLSTLVVWISLPALLVYNFQTYFDPSIFAQAGLSLLIPLPIMLAVYGLAYWVARLIKLPPQRRGVFAAVIGSSNTMFIGLPMCQALFGDTAIPYVFFYFACNALVFWSLFVAVLRIESGGAGEKVFGVQTLKKIFTPALVTFLIMLPIGMLRLRVPEPLLLTCKYLGAMSTPVALIYTGYRLFSIGLGVFKYEKGMALIMVGRFAVLPLAMYFAMALAGTSGLQQNVFLAQAAMPVMSQIPIVAQAYGGDTRYASMAVAVSTVLGMLVVPLYTIFLAA